MNVMRSRGQPELVHAVLTEKDVKDLIIALKKPKNDTAAQLRKSLKEVAK